MNQEQVSSAVTEDTVTRALTNEDHLRFAWTHLNRMSANLHSQGVDITEQINSIQFQIDQLRRGSIERFNKLTTL